jgi:DNA-binding NtrC family response regulator
VKNLRRTLKIRDGLEAQLLGNSVAITALRKMVTELADSPVDVLIEGETGTGKELVAQALHNLSSRKSHPFVALNCGAMSDSALDSELFGHESGAFTGAIKRRIGKIEYATGGTLFLDEVESMSVAMQVKLLRVLQERKIDRLGSNDTIPVNVRVIAASKDDLLANSRSGGFRADLYYRLNVAAIHIPPLREHRDDIRLLLEHFLVSAASRFVRPIPVVSPEQLHRLMTHEWPGNVRELKNVADCMVLGLPSVITPAAQSPAAAAAAAPASLTELVDGYERDLIAEALSQHNGNAAQAAKTLGVPKTTLAFKIKKYALSH